MSTTDEHPTPSGEQTQDPGPAFTRDRFHDIDQLQLSSNDRYIGGVAGGLGRHFGIDPIVVRVLLAALCLFGGIGLLIYGFLWAFVPSDRTGRAMIDLNGPTRRTILLVFGAIVALGIIGSVVGGFHGFGGGFAWPLSILVALVAVALAYLRPSNYRAPASSPLNPRLDDPPVAPTAPPAMPPTAPGAVASSSARPRPRRTGVVLFWPTLAVVIVAFGVLGLIAVDHPLAPLWWPGTALAIVGVALVIGAFVGRPGGLILAGILLLPPVAVTTVLGSHGWQRGDVNLTPVAAADVGSDYSIGIGQAQLDLSQVRTPSSLAGQTLRITMTAGRIHVTLPPGVAADVDAKLAVAGDVQVAGNEQSGLEPSLHETVGSGTGVPLHLILTGRVGQIEVDTTYPTPAN